MYDLHRCFLEIKDVYPQAFGPEQRASNARAVQRLFLAVTGNSPATINRSAELFKSEISASAAAGSLIYDY